MNMEIRFFDEKIPSDKTEKTAEDIFKSAGQIMFNYYKLVWKKDLRLMRAKYTVRLAKK